MTKDRSLGLRKHALPYGHLLTSLPSGQADSRAESRRKPRSPTPDIDAPPRDSSSEEPAVEDPDFEESIPAKRRKASSDAGSNTMIRRSPLLPGQDDVSSGTLPCEPSSLAPSTFTSRKQREGSEDEILFSSQLGSSQSKNRRTYGRSLVNIHASSPVEKQKKQTQKTSSRAPKHNVKGLKMKDINGLMSKVEAQKAKDHKAMSFKRPPAPMESPRSERATRRSLRDDDSMSGKEPSGGFRAPPNISSDVSPIKGKNGFVQPLPVAAGKASPGSATTSTVFKKPSELANSTELDIGYMQDLIARTIKEPGATDTQARPSDLSTTVSSSRSLVDDSSTSSPLSTPPSSPGLEEAVCPVCKLPVDREFFEEYENGKRLRSRQQLKFCKDHKARKANSEWAARGYPELEWQKFDERLRKYHPIIDTIVKGQRQSFYRNAAEDKMNQSKFTSMKRMYEDAAGVEGLSAGYYGSRGARAISENLTLHFASKLRRLAASDRIVQNTGVAAYIQAVLAPELAVLLVMDDMNTDEENARAILKDSTDIGNLLNEEEDDVIEVENEDEIS